MTTMDYNGTGSWSCEAIKVRYRDHARTFKVAQPVDLMPLEHIEGKRRWIYPIMEQVIQAIEKNDPAAIQIGVEFIEQDQHFPFGRVLKSNTARALRRASLSSYQEERIRKRIVTMLIDGRVPHEYKEYAKLLRRIGFGEMWPLIEERADRSNPYVLRYFQYFQYFQRHAQSKGSS